MLRQHQLQVRNQCDLHLSSSQLKNTMFIIWLSLCINLQSVKHSYVYLKVWFLFVFLKLLVSSNYFWTRNQTGRSQTNWEKFNYSLRQTNDSTLSKRSWQEAFSMYTRKHVNCGRICAWHVTCWSNNIQRDMYMIKPIT